MSWQDPVAIGLAAALVIVPLLLRRRLSKSACASCGPHDTRTTASPPTRVPVEALRLSRRR
jgi:hypothetical protein